jgi:hypothetical protein
MARRPVHLRLSRRRYRCQTLVAFDPVRLAAVLAAFIAGLLAVTFVAGTRFAVTFLAAARFAIGFIAPRVVPDAAFAPDLVSAAVGGEPAVLIACVKSCATAFHESATLLALTGSRRWAAR